MSKIYVETSFISYLAAPPSRDLIVAANQQITAEWWTKKRLGFELYASQLVVDEAADGNADMAAERLKILENIPLLKVPERTAQLVDDLIRRGPLPEKAAADALHIAIAAANGMDYLLTWNCKHIANARMRGKIEQLCRARDIEPPTICTPQELLEA